MLVGCHFGSVSTPAGEDRLVSSPDPFDGQTV